MEPLRCPVFVELARKYIETRDHEIIEELYKFRLELKRLGKESSA